MTRERYYRYMGWAGAVLFSAAIWALIYLGLMELGFRRMAW